MPGADGSRCGSSGGDGGGRWGDAAAQSSSAARRDRAARGATARRAISVGTLAGPKPRALDAFLTRAAWVSPRRAQQADSHRRSTVPGVVRNAIPGPDRDRNPLAAAVVVPDAEPIAGPIQIATDMRGRSRRHDLPAVGASSLRFGSRPPVAGQICPAGLPCTASELDAEAATAEPQPGVQGCRAPLLAGKETLAFLDIDSMQKRVYGRKKQGAAFGHTKTGGKSLLVRGLNALAATISTPLAAPVVAATRLRGGTPVVRADSAFYSAAVPCGRLGRSSRSRCGWTRRSSRRRSRPSARRPGGLEAHQVPRAIWDEQLACWVSGAHVAEATYTAFASKKGQAITARLIVRRVRDLNRKAAQGQGGLFPAWRCHAVFTGSPFVMLQAGEHHRDHAIVEQVFADWTDGPLAHLPSGSFPANAAWAALAAIAHNLLRAAGSLASLAYAGPCGPQRRSSSRYALRALHADPRPAPGVAWQLSGSRASTHNGSRAG